MWPCGIKKADLTCDEWLKTVASSGELRKQLHAHSISFPQFEKAYRRERENNETIKEVQLCAADGTLTLLTAAHTDGDNHVTVLRKLISS